MTVVLFYAERIIVFGERTFLSTQRNLYFDVQKSGFKKEYSEDHIKKKTNIILNNMISDKANLLNQRKERVHGLRDGLRLIMTTGGENG